MIRAANTMHAAAEKMTMLCTTMAEFRTEVQHLAEIVQNFHDAVDKYGEHVQAMRRMAEEVKEVAGRLDDDYEGKAEMEEGDEACCDVPECCCNLNSCECNSCRSFRGELSS